MDSIKKPYEKAEALYYECLTYVQMLQNEKAYNLMMSIIKECIDVHHNLDGDNCGIGNSYKYWIEVQNEAKYFKNN